MLRESLPFVVRRTFGWSIVGALTCGACAEGQPTEYADAAAPRDGAVVAEASAHMDAAAAPTHAACAELPGKEPRSISDVVARINQLPAPASIPGLIASLPRPLSPVASRTFVSDAMRAGRYFEQPIEAVRAARTRCDSVDGPQCARCSITARCVRGRSTPKSGSASDHRVRAPELRRETARSVRARRAHGRARRHRVRADARTPSGPLSPRQS